MGLDFHYGLGATADEARENRDGEEYSSDLSFDRHGFATSGTFNVSELLACLRETLGTSEEAVEAMEDVDLDDVIFWSRVLIILSSAAFSHRANYISFRYE